MKTFTERWVNGKLVRGEEAAAPPPLPTKADAFAAAAYGEVHGDADPPRGYHTHTVDHAPKKRALPFQRRDAVEVVDLMPGMRDV